MEVLLVVCGGLVLRGGGADERGGVRGGVLGPGLEQELCVLRLGLEVLAPRHQLVVVSLQQVVTVPRLAELQLRSLQFVTWNFTVLNDYYYSCLFLSI